MDSDSGLERLGTWARWKIWLMLIGSTSLSFPASWHMLAIVFLGIIPDFLCRLPPDAQTNTSIPFVLTEGEWRLDQCNVWVNYSIDSNVTQACPNGVTFLPGSRQYTIANEWNLVCDRSYLIETTQTVLVVGVMLGAMVTSIVSDVFGRKRTFLCSILAISIIAFITAWVEDYVTFTVLRFFTGFFQQGIVLAGFVYVCELFPASQRTEMGMMVQVFWAVGMWFLALLAFLVPHWRHLLVTISVPGVIAIPLLWVLPESIPWLVAKTRVVEAKQVLASAFRFSRVRLPLEFALTEKEEQLLMKKEKESKEKGVVGKMRDCCKGCCKKKEQEKVPSEEKAANYTIRDVLCSRKLLTFSLIMSYLWCVNALVYYGLSLSTGNLAGNLYLNFFLSGLVEVPAYLLAAFLLKRYGRRWPIFAFHLVAGISLFVTLFIPSRTADGTSLKPFIVTLSLIGKFGIAGSFGSVFLYAPELFPTTVRSIGMGIASVGGRLGNVAAPFASLVGRQVPWLPNVVFGVMAIIAALLTLLLPETLNRPLPRTIEDIENWSRTLSKMEKARFKAERKAQKEARELEALSRNGKHDPEEKRPLDAGPEVSDPVC